MHQDMQRIKSAVDILKSQGILGMLITNPYNIRYLSGFTGSSGFLFLSSSEVILFTDFRYIEQAQEETSNKGLKVVKHGQPAFKSIKEHLQKLDIKEVYFEKNQVTYAEYERLNKELDFLELKPHEGIVEELRACKDKEEVKNIEKACEIADNAFSMILAYISPGLNERDISLELEYFMKKSGARDTSFDIIVASGERSALPHGVASDKKLARQEFVKMDFGALYNGYSSDMTRTIFLGKAGTKEKNIYDIVEKAQREALNKIKPGMKAWEADEIARNIINQEGYKDCFGHGLGHGVGLEVHETPTLSPNSNTVLKAGMVVTIEPGVYIPGFGGVRIEDTALVTESGIKPLTVTTKELIELK